MKPPAGILVRPQGKIEIPNTAAGRYLIHLAIKLAESKKAA